jgi:hypothetical protein
MGDFPIEVIYHILEYLPVVMRVHDPSEFPWYLGHVNSSWRTAFFSAPWMWNKIVVAFGMINGLGMLSPNLPPDPAVEHAQHLVELCIERSKNWPLFLAVESSASQWEDIGGLEKVERILAALSAEAERWHSLELECNPIVIEKLLRPDAAKRFPRLHSLRLRSNCCNNIPSHLSSSFLDLPSLSHLDLELVPDWKFNLSHLTTLCLDDYPGFLLITKILPILSQLQCVERLAFGRPPPFSRDADTVVTLPRLKVLMCRSPILLYYLRAPVLEELHLEGAFIPPIIKFLQRSRSFRNFRRLTFEDGSPSLFEEIVRSVPEVANASFGVSELHSCPRSFMFDICGTDFITQQDSINHFSTGSNRDA